jgi:ribosomal protein S18 acetylase RimI-like enzyme
MYVSPDFRGSGVGKKLMQEVIERVKKIKGLSKIMLSVTQPQENSLKFYQRLGFEKYAVEKDALRVGDKMIDEIFMSLKIK